MSGDLGRLPYLRPDEQLLWQGRPDPDVRFSPADAFLIPFSLLWGGFAIVWEVAAVAGAASPFFVLWGIPFVALGFYLILGRFIYKRRRKLKALYAVTTQRAMVAVGDSSLVDAPLKYQPLTIKRSRDGRHVTAIIGNDGGALAWVSSYVRQYGVRLLQSRHAAGRLL